MVYEQFLNVRNMEVSCTKLPLTTSNKKLFLLLVTRKLLGAKGIARSKDATNVAQGGHTEQITEADTPKPLGE